MKIFKITSLSLLSALLAGLLLACLGNLLSTTGNDALPLIWEQQAFSVQTGSGAATEKGLKLELDQNGRGVIALPMHPQQSDNYGYLELQFTRTQPGGVVAVLWRTETSGAQTLHQQVPVIDGRPALLSTDELSGWSGKIIGMGLYIEGEPHEELLLEKMALLPPSLPENLRYLYRDWTTFTEWRQASVNAHPGGRASYLVPFMSGFFALGILAYTIILRYRSLAFDWRVVAAIFLACWIGLDLLWQGRLLHQLAETRQTFAGKDTAHKRAVGTDSKLVSFISQVGAQLAQDSSRIFVGSSNDYLGMRGAYYLYPFNVYWKRDGPELPEPRYLQTGDHIVLIKPSGIQFEQAQSTLKTPDGHIVSVAQLLSHPVGALYRVL